jgi:hypothetical protein
MWIDYSPPDLWLYYVQAVIYLGLVTLVASQFPRFAVCATGMMLVVGAIAYTAYHVTHAGPRYIQVFKSYERVTPYHEQLAVPAFLALLGGVAIAFIAFARSRRASALAA